jgi:hypothetical protein
MSAQMCASSVILDYGSNVPFYKWTKKAFDDYKSIIDKVKEWDEEIGAPECHDDTKGEWMDAVERRVVKLDKMIPTEVSNADLPQHLQDYLSEKDKNEERN